MKTPRSQNTKTLGLYFSHTPQPNPQREEQVIMQRRVVACVYWDLVQYQDRTMYGLAYLELQYPTAPWNSFRPAELGLKTILLDLHIGYDAAIGELDVKSSSAGS
jgi:hypothetical protein